MTTASMAIFGIGDEDQISQLKQQQPPLNPAMAPPAAPQTTAAPAAKKKRNLPGTPYPDAEVVALSPKTLMATNRFVCEVCGKGFQREQNLQLHRRGHNLPWKLKQKNPRDAARRKVYLCPEPSCVHHDPSRALGDLTGIKKHFSRKHGEKKWKCDKCSKKYAVQSDWKAHNKTCGTREYRCDCGTLFSRRDSFITHRAFCDALAQETARLPTTLAAFSSGPLAPPRQMFDHLLPQSAPSPYFNINELHHDLQPIANTAHQNLFNLNSSMMFDQFNNSSSSTSNEQQQPNSTLFANLYSSSMQQQQHHHHQESVAPPQMSATALLQKAAQMGATTSGGGGSSFAMFCNMNESKFRQAEEMTRDFLGVGSMLRMSQREQMGSSSAELGKSFAGGSLQ